MQAKPLLLGLEGCDSESQSPNLFDVEEPSGEYKLDMSLPFSRMVAAELVDLSGSKKGYEVKERLTAWGPVIAFFGVVVGNRGFATCLYLYTADYFHLLAQIPFYRRRCAVTFFTVLDRRYLVRQGSGVPRQAGTAGARQDRPRGVDPRQQAQKSEPMHPGDRGGDCVKKQLFMYEPFPP